MELIQNIIKPVARGVTQMVILGSKLKPLIAELTATGNGTGVSTLRFEVSEEQVITLDGTARFYTDSAGTTGESTSWTVTPGALRTIYLRAPSGTSYMRIPRPGRVINWGNTNTDGWTSGTNAARITITPAKLGLINLRITGNSVIVGALPENMTGTLRLEGSAISWTHTGALPQGITGQLYLSSSNIFWTYNGPFPSGVSAQLVIEGSNIFWTHNGPLPSGASIILQLNGSNINWTYNQIHGTTNFSTFNLANFRISKMSSADMVILLDSMRTKTGTFPATVTINDYADYLNPPQEVIDAVAALKAAKSITTVNLGA